MDTRFLRRLTLPELQSLALARPECAGEVVAEMNRRIAGLEEVARLARELKEGDNA